MRKLFSKLTTLIFFTSLLFLSSCKKDGVNVSTVSNSVGSVYTFEPSDRIELIGESIVTLELGQTYVDQGAFIVDTNKVYNSTGELVDSAFSNKPKILPDLSTEGVKTAIYYFKNKNNQECSIKRFIIVYKKPTQFSTNDISGRYKRGSAFVNIEKIADGTYYMDNVLATTSAVRGGVPALFYQNNDSTINIIGQYFLSPSSNYYSDYVTDAYTNKMLYLKGLEQKVSYFSTNPTVIISYRVFPITDDLIGAAGFNNATIKNTTFVLLKQP